MLAVAREKTTTETVEYRRGDLSEFEATDASFDIVLSSLALHYLPDFKKIAEKVFRALKSGGHFVFSVEHPVFTAEGSQEWQYDAEGKIQYFPVDRYFDEGQRTTNFLGESVTKYHRTLTTYLDDLLTSGFLIERIVEPMPSEAMLSLPGMQDELRRPMMLIIRAKKQ